MLASVGPKQWHTVPYVMISMWCEICGAPYVVQYVWCHRCGPIDVMQPMWCHTWCNLCGAAEVVQSTWCNRFDVGYVVYKLCCAIYAVRRMWCDRCGATYVVQSTWCNMYSVSYATASMRCNLRGAIDAAARRKRRARIRQIATHAQTTGGDAAATGRRRRARIRQAASQTHTTGGDGAAAGRRWRARSRPLTNQTPYTRKQCLGNVVSDAVQSQLRRHRQTPTSRGLRPQAFPPPEIERGPETLRTNGGPMVPRGRAATMG